MAVAGGALSTLSNCFPEEEVRRERHNVQRRAAFVKSQTASAWVLAEAWALDWSNTPVDSDARRWRRLNTHLLQVALAKFERLARLQTNGRRRKAESTTYPAPGGGGRASVSRPCSNGRSGMSRRLLGLPPLA